MTSSELNLKLTTSFPEIQDLYREETSWQDGDETGSHVVYADVFVPFIKGQMLAQNESMLVKIWLVLSNLWNYWLFNNCFYISKEMLHMYHLLRLILLI